VCAEKNKYNMALIVDDTRPIAKLLSEKQPFEFANIIYHWIYAKSAHFNQYQLDTVLNQLVERQLPTMFTGNVLVVMCTLLERVSVTTWRKTLLEINLDYSRYADGLPYLILIAVLIADKYLEQGDSHQFSFYKSIQRRSALSANVLLDLEICFLQSIDYNSHVTLTEFTTMAQDLVDGTRSLMPFLTQTHV